MDVSQGIFAIRGNLDGNQLQQEMDTNQYLGLRLQEEGFLISLDRIQEIILLPAITYVPQSPPFIEGVFNVRGKILPLVNIHKMMDLNPPIPKVSTRVIIFSIKEDADQILEFGVLVDGIEDVHTLSKKDIREQQMISGKKGADFIESISVHQQKITGILSLNRILSALKS